MRIKIHGFAVLLLALAGCSQLPLAPPPAADIWLDKQFDFQADSVTFGQGDLFRLDDELLATLRSPEVQNMSASRRVTYLVSSIIGPKTAEFLYSNAGSTVAAQTWKARRGDCLSLTVLSYAMAKELRLKASMQEVPVPVNIDRHGGIDYEAGHVNLYIDTNMSADLGTSITPKRGVIIDFEPTVGSARLGETQSPQSMLARFYNNLGAQSLVDGKYSRAYAHFRAAIQADPGFTGAFGNLAWLYQRMGYERDAEKVLLHATLLKTNSYVAIRGLHLLMVAQGRTQEAAKYEEILSAQRKQDPYYWIGVGLDQFKQENYHRAVDAFERAQSLTTGFSEVHRYLALAYLKEGQPTKVREQLIALESIDRNDPVLGPLNSKLKRLH